MDGGGPSTQPTWKGGSKRPQWLVSRGWGSPAHAPFSGSRLGLMPAPRRSNGRVGRSGGGGQGRPCHGHCSAGAPGRRCLPSGCSARRATRSRSPGRCQVAGPASCLHGPGAGRGGRRRPRWRRRRRRKSRRRRRPGSRPPGQRRRRLRPGSSALQPAPARPPASLALLSSLWSLALLLPIRLLGLHCRDT